MAGPRSFGESFRLHAAIQTIVTTAARDRSTVCGPSVVSTLARSFSTFTQVELEAILSRAAAEHDVAITTSAGRQSPVEGDVERGPEPAPHL